MGGYYRDNLKGFSLYFSVSLFVYILAYLNNQVPVVQDTPRQKTRATTVRAFRTE